MEHTFGDGEIALDKVDEISEGKYENNEEVVEDVI